MIRKSMPLGCDPMGGHRFLERIMLKKKDRATTRRKAVLLWHSRSDGSAAFGVIVPLSRVPLLVKYGYCVE
jgi:hypothetical protein